MIKIIRSIYLNSKNYFILHQSQLLLILILFILSTYIPQVPYLNKLITFWVRIGILWVISVLILKIKIRVSIAISLILTAIVLFISILQENEIAKILGNIIYFFLLIIFGQSFWQFLKEIKTNPK